MKVSLRGEKKEITAAMKEYAQEKLSKLDKYLKNPDEVEAHVLFKINGNKHKVEITIPIEKYTLRIEEKANDYYAAIDVAIDKLERQIRKNKTKIKSKNSKEFKYSAMEEYEENDSKIVKRKEIELKPIDEEEAQLQMELTDHDFYLFKNVNTGRLAVIYKRKDGNYGLIEAE